MEIQVFYSVTISYVVEYSLLFDQHVISTLCCNYNIIVHAVGPNLDKIIPGVHFDLLVWSSTNTG